MRLWEAAVVLAIIGILVNISIHISSSHGDTRNEFEICKHATLTDHGNTVNWLDRGQFVDIYGRQMFLIDQPQCTEDDTANHIFLLVHGFPTSSFDYHRVIDTLCKYGRVIAFDHIGFGFSEKPVSNITYSIETHADNLIHLLHRLQIMESAEHAKRIHIIAHDMGDSVVTELIARYKFNLLPFTQEAFKRNVQSVVFTNGGMKVNDINLRITQSLLLSPFAEYLVGILSKLPESVTRDISRKQLKGIWGDQTNANMHEDIDNIVTLLRCNDKNKVMAQKTIYYLVSRYKYEYKWMQALGRLTVDDFNVLLLWGDSDAVSPVIIPQKVYRTIPESVNKELKYLKGCGHFLMLEQPDLWLHSVLQWTVRK